MAHPLTTVEKFNYNTLNKELELHPQEKETSEVFFRAYMDDFWQDGKSSLLPAASGSRSGDINKIFEKRFVFRNVVRECVSRVTGVFFGKGPNWRFRLNGETAETTETLAAIDKALGEFYTKQRVAQVLAKAFESRLAFGRGAVRVYIPTRYKRANQVATDEGTETSEVYVQFSSITDAIAAMRVEFVEPTQSRLLNDGGELFSILKYKVRVDWETRRDENVLEFSFVDDADMTFVGTLPETGQGSSLESANLSSGFDLAGYTTLSEFKGEPYVTRGLFRNNQLVNLALTCAGFSLVDNGFGEMILTNVELETDTVTGPDGEPVEVPRRIRRGGGVTQNFVGMQTFDEVTGASRRETPGVTFRDPSPMNPYKDGYDLAYAACLQEADQLHALISGDAAASGESRIQALVNFALRVKPYKVEVDEMGSAVMTTVLLWAAGISGTPMKGYTIAFDSRMHVSDLSESEKRLVMDMRVKGVISRETERILLGIDEPGVESEKILEEQSSAPAETTVEEFSEKLDVALKMLSVNINPEVVQEFLGFTEEQIAAMTQAAADREAAMLAQFNQQTGDGGGTVAPADLPTSPNDQQPNLNNVG